MESMGRDSGQWPEKASPTFGPIFHVTQGEGCEKSWLAAYCYMSRTYPVPRSCGTPFPSQRNRSKLQIKQGSHAAPCSLVGAESERDPEASSLLLPPLCWQTGSCLCSLEQKKQNKPKGNAQF